MISGLDFYHVCIKGGVKKHRDRVCACCMRTRADDMQDKQARQPQKSLTGLRCVSPATPSCIIATRRIAWPSLEQPGGVIPDATLWVKGLKPSARCCTWMFSSVVVDVIARALVARHRRLQLAADVLGGVPILWVITRDNAAWRVASRAAHGKASRE